MWKRTLLLSNVPRPNDAVRTMMRRMGIDDGLYTGILTSGEAVRQALRRPPDLWWAELGTRVFHLGPDRDKPVLEGLPFVVNTPADADFVLNTGPDDHRTPASWPNSSRVPECARHRLKMSAPTRSGGHSWRRARAVCGARWPNATGAGR
jgi:ribonucleotide monophosphatase NagD (HAD superfamily)